MSSSSSKRPIVVEVKCVVDGSEFRYFSCKSIVKPISIELILQLIGEVWR